MALSSKRSTQTNWGALSIQERIRAMNDTLDLVDQKKNNEGEVSTGPKNNKDVLDDESPPKRESIIEMWRKREASTSVEKPKAARPLQLQTDSPGNRKFSNHVNQNSLKDVKTALSSQFHQQHFASIHRTASETENEEDKSTTTMDTQNSKDWKNLTFPSCRIDSATPTPPKIPGSSPPKKWIASKVAHVVQKADEDINFTIVPAGTASPRDKKRTTTIGLDATSPRNTEDDADRDATDNMISKNDDIPDTPLSLESDSVYSQKTATPNSTETIPTRKKSVIDIWKHRTSASPEKSQHSEFKSTIQSPGKKSPYVSQEASPGSTPYCTALPQTSSTPPPVPMRKWSPKTPPTQSESDVVSSIPNVNLQLMKTPSPVGVPNRWSQLRSISLNEEETTSITSDNTSHQSDKVAIQKESGKVTDRWVQSNSPTMKSNDKKSPIVPKSVVGKLAERIQALEMRSASPITTGALPSTSSLLSNVQPNAVPTAATTTRRNVSKNHWLGSPQKKQSATNVAIPQSTNHSNSNYNCEDSVHDESIDLEQFQSNSIESNNSDTCQQVATSNKQDSVSSGDRKTSLLDVVSTMNGSDIKKNDPNSQQLHQDHFFSRCSNTDEDHDEKKMDDVSCTSQSPTLIKLSNRRVGKPPTLAPLDKNISELVKEHAVRTPLGRLRNKAILGSGNKGTPPTESQSSEIGSGTPASVKSKFSINSNDSMQSKESVESASLTNTKSNEYRTNSLIACALRVDDNIAEIVKEHAARTPSGQKRIRVSKELMSDQQGTTDTEMNTSTATTHAERIDVEENVESLVLSRMDDSTRQPLDRENTESPLMATLKDGPFYENADNQSTTSKSHSQKHSQEKVVDRWNKRLSIGNERKCTSLPGTNDSGLFKELDEIVRCTTLSADDSDPVADLDDSCLHSPMNIVQAWSNDKTEAISKDESLLEEKDIQTSLEESHSEEELEGNVTDDKIDLTSPFKIIEAWSHKSRPRPEAQQRLPLTHFIKPKPEIAIEKKVSYSKTVIDLHSRDRTAPCHIGNETPNDKIRKHEMDEAVQMQTKNTKKSLTMLGRKHLAHRTFQKNVSKSQDSRESTETEGPLHTAPSKDQNSNDSEGVKGNRVLQSEIRSTTIPASYVKEKSQICQATSKEVKDILKADSGLGMVFYDQQYSHSKNPSSSMYSPPILQPYQQSPTKPRPQSDAPHELSSNVKRLDPILPSNKKHNHSQYLQRPTNSQKKSRVTHPCTNTVKEYCERTSAVPSDYSSHHTLFANSRCTSDDQPRKDEFTQEHLNYPSESLDDPIVSNTYRNVQLSKSSSSFLSSQAEKVLQNRRRNNHERMSQAPSMQYESELDQILAELPSPDLDDGPSLSFEEESYTVHKPKLTSKYRRQSRFMDSDSPSQDPSIDLPDETSDSNEALTNETMSFQSQDYTASDTHNGSRIKNNFEDKPDARRKSSRRRKGHEHCSIPHREDSIPNAGICKATEGVNEIANGLFPTSFDFGKFASVVDEQISALRAMVVTSMSDNGKMKKQKLKIPKHPGLDPFDTEDVAIEVEYMDDDVDDDSSRKSNDALTNPFGDSFDKKAMEYAKYAVPTGEPSFESRLTDCPSTPENIRRRRYV